MKKKKNKSIKPSLKEKIAFSLFKKTVAAKHLKQNYGFVVKRKDRIKIDEPFIVMSNHLTDNDLYFPILTIKNYMYFACSEHLYREGNMDKVIDFFHAVTMYKGSQGSSVAKEIIRRERAGQNICLFPEGSRTFNGYTNPIAKSTGGLVKASKCALVTYKLEGGYFAAPRWSRKPRKGPIKGYIKNIYKASELAKMSSEEIQLLIERDLYEDAFSRQDQLMNKYVREDKCYAEGLENFLFICPKCGGFETIKSKIDKFWCTNCDVEGTMDEYGYMVGDKAPFKKVPDWEDDLNKKFDEMYAKGDMKVSSENVDLVLINPDHTITKLYNGPISGDYEGITAGEYRFNYLNMEATEYINLGNTFLFTVSGNHYYLVADYLNGIKYRKMYWKIKEKYCAEKGIPFDIAK